MAARTVRAQEPNAAPLHPSMSFREQLKAFLSGLRTLGVDGPPGGRGLILGVTTATSMALILQLETRETMEASLDVRWGNTPAKDSMRLFHFSKRAREGHRTTTA